MINVDKTTDKLGMHIIDEGIKRAVLILNQAGFRTTMSCEGHLMGRGCPFPWVDIATKEPEGWKENEEIKKAWSIENMKQAERMINLLDEFYRQKPPRHFGLMLILDWRGIYGAFRLQSCDARIMLIGENLFEKYRLYNREMSKFIDFLEEKFKLV